jgi:hypothetical protein
MKLNIYLESGIKIDLPAKIEKQVFKIIFGATEEAPLPATKRKTRRKRNARKIWEKEEHKILEEAVRDANGVPSQATLRAIARKLGRTHASVATRIYNEIIKV